MFFPCLQAEFCFFVEFLLLKRRCVRALVLQMIQSVQVVSILLEVVPIRVSFAALLLLVPLLIPVNRVEQEHVKLQ